MHSELCMGHRVPRLAKILFGRAFDPDRGQCGNQVGFEVGLGQERHAAFTLEGIAQFANATTRRDDDRQCWVNRADFADQDIALAVRQADIDDGRIDAAVHSLKDLPTVVPEGLALACVPVRAAPFDAFVGRTAPTLAEIRGLYSTDPAKIVFYPNYFAWFDESARMYFDSVGLDWDTLMQKYGIPGLPIVEAKANFLAPCVFRDEITIVTPVWPDAKVDAKAAYARACERLSAQTNACQEAPGVASSNRCSHATLGSAGDCNLRRL